MSYINHLRQTNSGQDIVHSQFLKTARILASFIVIVIFCGAAWLFVRDEKFLLSDSAFVILTEALMTIAIFVILVWKSSKIIETACIQRDKAISTLRENEAKFKNFVDATFIGVIELDADGRIYVANDEFLRITGYTDSYLQAGKLNWFDITPLEYKELESEIFSQAKTLSSCKPYEKKLICADGTQVEVKVSCIHLELEEKVKSNNRPHKYIVHVSERDKTEKNPVLEQHLLENLLNILPAPLLLVEPGTAKVTFANEAANKMAGGQFPLAQSQEECSNLYRFTDANGKVIPSELTPPIRVALGEKLEGVEINWHQRDNIYQLKVFADTLPPTNGYPATCVALFQDISQLKQLEESSRLVNERLKLVFDTTSYFISSIQPEELIEVLYGDIAEKLGLDCYLYYLADNNSQEIKLTSYSGITSSQAKDLEQQKIGQGISGTVASERTAINIENLQQSKGLETEPIGSNGILAYYSCPLLAQEQLLGTISFASRTRSGFKNEEIGIMQTICNQISIAIVRANLTKSLQQANCIKDEFLAILSHELRSPLNSILGWSQYLQVRKLDENTTSRALESIERNARDLHHTIEELLDMSRTVQGKMQLNIKNCNLASIIVTVVENLRSASLAKQIGIKLSFHKGLEMNERTENTEFVDTFDSLKQLASLTKISASYDAAILKNRNFLVAGDSQRLSQVMWNLLSNAIKFTSCGGCVEVRLSEEKRNEDALSYAVIQVSDTGMGINSEFIPYVFDRFRQGDSSNTREHNGLGLGLSIVRHIVELHGGSVDVESPGIGEGSTFTVKLPLVKPTESQFTKKKCSEKFVVIN